MAVIITLKLKAEHFRGVNSYYLFRSSFIYLNFKCCLFSQCLDNCVRFAIGRVLSFFSLNLYLRKACTCCSLQINFLSESQGKLNPFQKTNSLTSFPFFIFNFESLFPFRMRLFPLEIFFCLILTFRNVSL